MDKKLAQYLGKELHELTEKAIKSNDRQSALKMRDELYRRIENRLGADKSPSYSQLIWFYKISCLLDVEERDS
tara:strand:+ start:137 stop:355 length:219 start_codon:yes stop_codon:yes gene_type:complete